MSFLILSELLIRASFAALYHDPAALFHRYGSEPSPLLGFELTPNVRNQFLPGLATTYSTNSEGFRGAEEFPEKEKDEWRIALLGESCVFGHSASGDAASLGALLKSELQKKYPEKKISVINAGNPGYVSYQVFSKLVLQVLPHKPTVCVLYTGWNDVFEAGHHPEASLNRIADEEILRTRSWQTFIDTRNERLARYPWLRRLAISMLVLKICDRLFPTTPAQWMAQIESALSRPGVQQKVRRQFQQNLNHIRGLLEAEHVPLIVVTLFSETDAFPKSRGLMNEIIRQTSHHQDMWLIDADQRVLSRPRSGLNARDGYHLTDKGNLFLASLIEAEISAIAVRRLPGDEIKAAFHPADNETIQEKRNL